MICPLCQGSGELFTGDRRRSYVKCSDCDLLFVPGQEHISSTAELQRYEAHNNSVDDPRYVSYLRDIRDQIVPFLTSASSGLDFGCGKTELLSQLFKEKSFPMESFDLFFHPRDEVWSKTYDFIVLSEVIEHLRDPLPTMTRLKETLRPRGQFFLKTKFYPSSAELFKNWYYKNDLTHVLFFNESSMSRLGERLGGRVQFLGHDLTVISLR